MEHMMDVLLIVLNICIVSNLLTFALYVVNI